MQFISLLLSGFDFGSLFGLVSLKENLGSLIREESGQDGIEYLLVIGGVSVAIVLAIIAVPGFVTQIISGVCTAVSGIPGMSSVSC